MCIIETSNTRKLIAAFGIIVSTSTSGTIPDDYIRFSPSHIAYDALYIDHDYECTQMLSSLYFDDRTNLYAMVSNTLVKAEDPNDRDAPLRLSYCYLRELGGLKKDYTEALKWLHIAEKRGSTAALYSLGRLYSYRSWDWPVKQNLVVALDYYKKAAEAGLPAAMSRLGVCYANGEGGQRDDYIAFSWFRKAADKGDYLGQCNFVIGLLTGRGTRRDVAQAKFLMLKYADARSSLWGSNGSARTMQEWLGDFFSNGVYEPRNIDNAVYWYSRCGGKYSSRRMCELLGLYPDYYAIDLRGGAASKRLKIKKLDLPNDGVWPEVYKTDFLLLRKIDGGSFIFGSRDNEPGRYPNENRCQQLVVDGPYYLGVYEVTRAQWNHVMGSVSNIGEDNPRHPVSGVPFYQTYGLQKANGPRMINFLKELSEKTGMWFHAPSEEEWEFACRAGDEKQNLYGWGNDESCLNIEGRYLCNGGTLSEVGRYKPNAFGLYDMIGNVWESIDNRFNLSKVETPAFPLFGRTMSITNFIEGPLAYEEKRQLSVVRGGSWRSSANDCRIGVRYFIDIQKGYDSVGLRVSMKLPMDNEWILDLAESFEEEP